MSTGQSDEHGLKTLIARAEAGEVIVFVAMCDRIAQILAARGRHLPGRRPPRPRRRHPRPTRQSPGDAATPRRPPTHPTDTDARRPTTTRRTRRCGVRRAARPGRDAVPDRPRQDPPEGGAAAADQRGSPTGRRGVASLENDGVGPITVAEAIALLGHCQVSVRPVLDLRDQLPVDCYEIPAAMREALRLSRPASVFPWTHTGSRHSRGRRRPHPPLRARRRRRRPAARPGSTTSAR